jgi:hypothetical protein
MCAHVRIEAAQRESAARQSSGVLAAGPETTAGVGPERPRVHAAVRRALNALEQSGVSWALLRGESELASTDQDVDILASPSDLLRLEQALAPLAYIRLPSHGRGSHAFFVTYDHADDCWVKLDVVTDLAFGRFQELRLEGAAGCLARRRQVGDLVLLAADDEFWTLLLHCLLDAGTFRDAHRRSLLNLTREASLGAPLVRELERAVGRGWASTLVALAKRGDWAGLEGAAPSLRAAWIRRRPLGVGTTYVWNAALRRAGRIPPLCHGGLTLRAQPADSSLAAQVTDRWFLPHRRVRAAGSSAARLGRAAAARWHAARGRLVLLELGESARPSRFLDWLSGASDFRSAAGLTHARDSLPAAMAGIWRRYVERAGL